MKIALVIMSILFFYSESGYALPVTTKDHFAFSSSNTTRLNELLLSFTLTDTYAAGMSYIHLGHSEFFIPRIDVILHRWEISEYKIALFGSLGVGIESFSGNQYNALLGELTAEMKHPLYYGFFEHLYLLRDGTRASTPDYNHTKLKAGISAYDATASELGTIVLVQFDKTNSDDVNTTQFLRFTYRNASWEVGADFEGKYAFNFNIGI